VTRITLLTRSGCDLCEQAKTTLDRLRNQLGDVTVEFVDVDTVEGRRMAGETGMVFPPGLLVDGQAFSYGRLSERKLRRALAARPKLGDRRP
jgi:glutaredoxin